MDDQQQRLTNWPVVGGVAAAAALLGFGASRILGPREVAPVAAPVAAPAKDGPAEVAIPAA